MRIPPSVVLVAAAMLLPAALPAQQTITGQAAFADWNQQQPGVRSLDQRGPRWQHDLRAGPAGGN